MTPNASSLAAGLLAAALAVVAPGAAGQDAAIEPLVTRCYDVAAGDGFVVTAAEAGIVTYAADGGKRLGVAVLPGSATRVVLAGDVAWTALGPNGLAAVSVADPANPRVLSRLETLASVQGVAVAGGRVYLAEGNAGLAIVDGSDPLSLRRLGRLPLGDYCRGVDVSGDVAVVAASAGGLVVVDVSDPARPRRQGFLQLGGAVQDAVFAGSTGLVLASAGERGAFLVDVRQRAAPAARGSVPTRDFARGVAVAGDEAAIADGGGGVVLASIANPDAPSVTRRVATKGQGLRVAFRADGRSLVAADASGWSLVE